MMTDNSWDRFLDNLDEYNKSKGKLFMTNLLSAIELDSSFHAEERKKFEEKCRVFWKALNGQRSDW